MESVDDTKPEVKNERVQEAERRIQNFIILRAWREQREKNKNYEKDIKRLSNQVENLQMQTYALKQLLNAEKTRVVQANSDLRKVLNALEESKYEQKSLINEKEQLRGRLHSMEEQIMSMENECKNKKNELITARSEAQNWEKQLEKERDKLSKLRDEKKFLIEEVRFKGNLLVWQIRSFEQFSRLYNILQGKPNHPALPWEDAIGGNDRQISEMSKAIKIPKRQQTIIILEKPPEMLEPSAVLARVERKPGDEPEVEVEEEDEKTEQSEESILEKTKEPDFQIL